MTGMLRVLIADDEERICKLIVALGEWERLGLEVAGMAHSGQEALEKIRDLKPDILITDIRMPGLSGLEVISQAKAFAPGLEVVIISGYAQFDYAQTAIRNGVGEYLLKPINKEALNHILEKMADSLTERKRRDDDVEALRLNSQDDRERLRQKLATDLWLNGRAPANREELRSVYHFDGERAGFQTLLLKADSPVEDMGNRFADAVWKRALDMLGPVLSKLCGDWVCHGFGNLAAAVLCLDEEALPELRAQLRGVLNQLVAEKGMFGAVEFSMALGAYCREPDGLDASFRAANRALAERLVEGTGRLTEGEWPPSGVLDMEYQARYAQAAAHAIEVLSQEEAEAAAEQLRAAADYPGLRGWEALEMVENAGRLFIARLNAEDGEQATKAFHDSLDQCGELSLLFDRLKAMQAAQLGLAVQRRTDRDAQPIRCAKLYIHKHFAEAITLEDVSAACGFSVNYFSTLFKKETGEGFAKYLTKVRMDSARGLLRETNLSVAEICGKVGYSDVKHFTKTFKAEAGLTPGEYRKLYG